MDILNGQIFALDEARYDLIALAIKASTQRNIVQKDGFKMFRNLCYRVLSFTVDQI